MPVHPLERAEAGRLPRPRTRSAGSASGGNGCGRSCASTRSVLPADPDLEGVHRPGQGHQARPDRVRDQPLPGALLRVRPVRAACRSGPATASTWAPASRKPMRLPATYHRTHGIRYFHGCYSLGDDQLWGVDPPPQGRRPHAGRAQVDPGRPPGRRTDLRDHGQPVGEQDPRHPGLGGRNKVELCFTPTNASWANPIEAQFGPLRTFTMGASNHPNHTVAGPATAGLPALAQHQRPPPRRPRRPTPRTSPHPQRTPTTLGTTQNHPAAHPARSRLTTDTGKVCGQRTRGRIGGMTDDGQERDPDRGRGDAAGRLRHVAGDRTPRVRDDAPGARRRLSPPRHGHDVRQRGRGGPGDPDSGLRREDVFVTTKIPAGTGRPRARHAHGEPESARDGPRRPLADPLATAGTGPPTDVGRNCSTPGGDGLVRAVGVSITASAQIDELIATTGEAPAVQPDPVEPI